MIKNASEGVPWMEIEDKRWRKTENVKIHQGVPNNSCTHNVIEKCVVMCSIFILVPRENYRMFCKRCGQNASALIKSRIPIHVIKAKYLSGMQVQTMRMRCDSSITRLCTKALMCIRFNMNQ